MKLKKTLCAVLAALVVSVSVCSCSKLYMTQQNPSDIVEGESGKTIEEIIKEAQQNGPVAPEGDITEIWFDEPFAAFYPMQFGDSEMYFSKIYLYGDLELKQPAICLCSEKLTDISLFSISSGEELYTVDALEPMEAIVLQTELAETADIGIRFKDEAGTEHSYSIARNADGTQVVTAKL